MRPSPAGDARRDSGRPPWLGRRRLLFEELQLAGLDVDPHGVSLREFPLQDLHRQGIQDAPLKCALERARAIRRIVAFGEQEILGGFAELDPDLALFQSRDQATHLDVNDGAQVLPTQGVKENDLVDPIEEFRTEVGPAACR